jgi:glycine cleavage system transcriptional repressor
MKSRHCLLTVTGKDRPGIIAELTGLLYDHRCNLEDIAMTILEGEFAMMLVVGLGKGSRAGDLTKTLGIFAKKSAMTIHRHELADRLVRGESHARGFRPHLITAIGKDRTGIVYRISRLLAKSRLNITDLNSRILGYGAKALYAMMLEVDVPRRFDVSKLNTDLTHLGKLLRVEIKIKACEPIQF